MTEGRKPRLIGINHVAIEVGNIDEALDWYGQIFDFKYWCLVHLAENLCLNKFQSSRL